VAPLISKHPSAPYHFFKLHAHTLSLSKLMKYYFTMPSSEILEELQELIIKYESSFAPLSVRLCAFTLVL